MKFANDGYFTKISRGEAAANMFEPKSVEIDKGKLIHRFGWSVDNAWRGCWWTEDDQFQRIQRWAAERGLTVPHAARLLLAVLHAWGEKVPPGNNMLVQVRATVEVPLRAYRGLTRSKAKYGEGQLAHTRIEGVNPRGSADAKIFQLYIPGLGALPSSISPCGQPTMIDVGQSHIFGDPLVPPGTVMQ